jgi:hypothetical protein
MELSGFEIWLRKNVKDLQLIHIVIQLYTAYRTRVIDITEVNNKSDRGP